MIHMFVILRLITTAQGALGRKKYLGMNSSWFRFWLATLSSLEQNELMALGFVWAPLTLPWVWTLTALIFKSELTQGQVRKGCSSSCVCYHPDCKANSRSENKEGKSSKSMKKLLWQQGPWLWKALHDKTWGFLCFYPNMPKSTQHTSVKIQAWKTARCAGNQGKFLRHLLTWGMWW